MNPNMTNALSAVDAVELQESAREKVTNTTDVDEKKRRKKWHPQFHFLIRKKRWEIFEVFFFLFKFFFYFSF